MRRLILAALLALAPLAANAQMPRIEPLGPLGGPALPQPPDPSVPPSVPAETKAPDLVVDLSLARVSITSAFQGESILLFGMFDPPGDIVVVVQGPQARETVMRKERVLGVWLNTGRQTFDNVPAYYAIAASQALPRLLARGAGGEILSLEDRLALMKAVDARAAADLARFRSGLVEVKRRDGLYPAAIGQVQIQANRLFRVDLPFPSKLPEGIYEVRAYLLREGRIVAAVSRPLPVGKVGFSAKLAGWATDDGALYGMAAIAMALFAGWFGGAVVRRISLT
ncbi:MAG TPA: TIGR02186 family protein [Reyranellaceae bacterium]|nr:TIGR02186 family protein [Reyranellaceae bacterium]